MFEKCEYIKSSMNRSQSPNINNLPEFVFLGRSNVGKSSLINAITNRKMLAKTSSNPGKTICVNYFMIDDAFYFVDVPGYGYANRDKERIESFGNAIEDYLNNNNNLKICFLLVDTKIGPTKDDILMYNYLKHYDINTIIVATKCDKIGTTLRARCVKEIISKLQNSEVYLTSSEKRIGIDKLIDCLKVYL